ncbi:MAG: DUF1343 domain-containing protein [Gemmatimonadaceae bacterium]|nr:DUF1343 domain-containing protein [Gemmatimonadaceae bacterium]
MTHRESGLERVSAQVRRKEQRDRLIRRAVVLALGMFAAACASNGPPDNGPMPDDGIDGMPFRGNRKVRLGITVLLDDSIKLVAGKRVALITNQTGVDEKGRRTIDLLATDPRAQRAGVKLVRLFAPEHGANGTADKPNLADDTDLKTGLVVYSLYQRSTIAPPDSLLKDVDVLVVDLQDIGTRTWTYVGVMLFAMKAGERRSIPVLVLDRPNPITGSRTEGAVLDSALANPNEPTADRPGNGFALYPMPLRHGLTMGELARLFQVQLKLGTRLTVVPMRNWRRQMWFDETSISWVRPSPNLPHLVNALLYPALVPFESSNLSVGRGTSEPFQRFGAPWLRADTLVQLLEDLSLSGVRFRAERFTPNQPGDGKYGGQSIPGVRIEVTDRDRVQPARIGAAILWALSRIQKDSLRITASGFDLRMGSSRVRESILAGADPDAVMDRQLPAVVAFERDARRIHLYR